ncbi:DNA (cytosine-5-)-methyltransferase [Candidatus Margulisiibacteriota bacterium]
MAKNKTTFVDLFAGIGGFRLAFESLGSKCTFSSEWDRYAQETYQTNFKEIPKGDISKINTDDVPNHDILCAGFPCQAFSICGSMKGFEDTRGTLFFELLRIASIKKPKVLFLENVKHLIHHDNKRTLATIIKHLLNLGYKVSYEILNAKDFGVPQNRERLVIICNKEKLFNFGSIRKTPSGCIEDFLEKKADFEYLPKKSYTLIKNPIRQESGLIFVGHRNKPIRKNGIRPNTEHLSRVHKQPNRIYSAKGIHPTIPSQEPTGRFYILHNNKVRKLTINECYKLMGFPDSFKKPVPQAEQYKQIGNSICVPMVKAVGKEILRQLL